MKRLMIAVLIMIIPSISLAAGELLKLNTKGKEYCPGKAPLAFTPSTDIDMWLYIDSATVATIYANEGMTMEVETLNIRADAVSSKRRSFSAFAGSQSGHIAAVGEFLLDDASNIKAIKATLIRRGVINSCYSVATVTGKRVQ